MLLPPCPDLDPPSRLALSPPILLSFGLSSWTRRSANCSVHTLRSSVKRMCRIRAKSLFEWAVAGTSLVQNRCLFTVSKTDRFTVLGTFSGGRLTRIQNGVFLCTLR